MTNEEAQYLVGLGCIPQDWLVNPGLVGDLNFEAFSQCWWGNDSENYVPRQYDITQDVYAPDIPAEDPWQPTEGQVMYEPQPIADLAFPIAALTIEQNVYAPVEEAPMDLLDAYSSGFVGVDDAVEVGAGSLVWDGAMWILKTAAGAIAGHEIASAVFGGGSSLQSTSAPAPKAGLLTGSCPPGRVVRKIAYGRDICIRKPKMNPLNPKALRRATTRISRFHHFAVQAEKEMAAAFRKGGFHPGRAVARTGGKCGSCRKTKCSCG